LNLTKENTGMPKQQPKKQVAQPTPANGGRKQINRTRRNALERKCLPKALKVLFAGSPRPVVKAVYLAWLESRKRVRAEE